MKDMVRLFKTEFGDFDNFVFATSDSNPSAGKPKQAISVNSECQISLDKIRPLLAKPTYFLGGESEAIARLEKKVISQHDYVNSFNKPKSISTNTKGNPKMPTTTGLSPYISTGCLSIRRLVEFMLKTFNNQVRHCASGFTHGQIMFREMFYLLSRSIENWDQDSGNSQCKEIEWEN